MPGNIEDGCFPAFLFRAQTAGFEPAYRLPGKLISSQPRYDHFDTSADR